MFNFQFSYENIIEGQGFELAIAGMIIVFIVLASLSLFITLLPKILAKLNCYLPEQQNPHLELPAPATNSNDKAIIAATCYVFHQSAKSKK